MKKTILTMALLSTVSFLSFSAFAQGPQYKVTCGLSQGQVLADGSTRYVTVPGSEKSQAIELNGNSTKILIDIKTTKGEEVEVMGLASVFQLTPEMAQADIQLMVSFPESTKSVNTIGGNTIDPRISGDVFSQGLAFNTGSDASDYFKASCTIQK